MYTLVADIHVTCSQRGQLVGGQFSPCASQETDLGFEGWWQTPSPHCITLLTPSSLRHGLSLAWSTSQQANKSQDLPSTGVFPFYLILFLFCDRFILYVFSPFPFNPHYPVLSLMQPVVRFGDGTQVLTSILLTVISP